jgi:clan AA aspartic protease (TIGR02281 family)
MKRKIAGGLIFIAINFCLALPCPADIVHLANGRQMECMVKTQSKDSVEFEVEIGTIRLRNSEISRIERFTPAENAQMVKQWEAHKLKADLARKAWQEAQEQERQRQALLPKHVDTKVENGHMVVSASINKTVNVRLLVDTGASVVVLSRAVGEKLGLVTVQDTADNKKMKIVQLKVADGRKVDAKYVVLSSITVQDSEANDVEAAIILDDNAEVINDGVLGMSYLKRFNVSFNNKDSTLTLEKLK